MIVLCDTLQRNSRFFYSMLYQQIYSGARDGSVVASKLDLRVYHPCKVSFDGIEVFERSFNSEYISSNLLYEM